MRKLDSKKRIDLSKTRTLLSGIVVQRKILAIVVLIVFLSPTFVQNFAMGQSVTNYCPQSVDQKYCHKVIIVGAGMAGLGAAKELQSHGYDFIILESDNTPGGRVVTAHASINGKEIIYDTHASFISGSTGNPISELAILYNKTGNIILKISDYNNSTLYDNNGPVTDPVRLNRMNETYNNFITWMYAERQNKTVDEPLQNAIDAFNKTQALNENDSRDFAYEISSNIGDEWANDPANMSLLYWDKIGYRVAGPDVVFPHGFGDIVSGLVNDIGQTNIQYNTTVTQVYYTDQGVKVETDNGNGPTYYGRYVICTLPLTVLQSNMVSFTPSMPHDKINAINKMDMGTLAQTYFYFKNGVFWDNADWIYYIPPSNEPGHFVAFENMYRVNGQPMLLAFNYGKYAIQLITESDNKIKKDLLEALGHMYPGKSSLDTVQIVYRGETPSYSTNPVGFKVPDDYNLLSNPLTDDNGTNRVFFAGEATTWHFPATTHGAFISGLREANRVMVTDTGKYPTPLEQGKNWRYPAKSETEPYWMTFPEYVMCKPGFVLLAKSSDMSPLCISPDHIQRLVQSNFARNPTLP